jgi:hypothetical protein
VGLGEVGWVAEMVGIEYDDEQTGFKMCKMMEERTE